MRTKLSLCVLAAFAMSSPALAAIGQIQYDLTHSGGSNSNIIAIQGVGGAFPVEISFSGTTSGDTGVNRGVAGINFKLNTGLPLIDQLPVVLNPALIGPHGGTTTGNLGFGSFADEGAPKDEGGDAAKETIDAIGAFQGLAPDFDFKNAKGVTKHGSMAEHVGTGAVSWNGESFPGPILAATTNVLVAPATPAGTYILTLTSLSAKMWNTDPGSATQDVPAIGDTLTLVVVPEPATMLLFAPLAWAIRRRRNQR